MKKTMATNFLSLFFTFLLFFASADGRSLHKTNASENIEFRRPFFSNEIKVTKGVYLASDDNYTGKTNYNDVLGLVALCTSYRWLLEDNEDPCVAPKWNWIECNSDPNPRIIALELSARLLVAPIPDFSSMDALQRIDLSLNSIYGAIPSFLSTFPDLQELITGNTNLYSLDSCSSSNNSPSPPANRNSNSDGRSFSNTTSKKKSSIPVIIGSIVGVFAFIGIGVGIFAIYSHKARTAAAIAEASSPGPNVAKGNNVPIEEIPMNSRSNNMSPL